MNRPRSPQPIALGTGASSGIGQATAHVLSQAGYPVYARPKIRHAPGLAHRMRMLRLLAPAGVLDAGARKDLRLPA